MLTISEQRRCTAYAALMKSRLYDAQAPPRNGARSSRRWSGARASMQVAVETAVPPLRHDEPDTRTAGEKRRVLPRHDNTVYPSGIRFVQAGWQGPTFRSRCPKTGTSRHDVDIATQTPQSMFNGPLTSPFVHPVAITRRARRPVEWTPLPGGNGFGRLATRCRPARRGPPLSMPVRPRRRCPRSPDELGSRRVEDAGKSSHRFCSSPPLRPALPFLASRRSVSDARDEARGQSSMRPLPPRLRRIMEYSAGKLARTLTLPVSRWRSRSLSARVFTEHAFPREFLLTPLTEPRQTVPL